MIGLRGGVGGFAAKGVFFLVCDMFWLGGVKGGGFFVSTGLFVITLQLTSSCVFFEAHSSFSNFSRKCTLHFVRGSYADIP